MAQAKVIDSTYVIKVFRTPEILSILHLTCGSLDLWLMLIHLGLLHIYNTPVSTVVFKGAFKIVSHWQSVFFF